jgi:hypothetical protein
MTLRDILQRTPSRTVRAKCKLLAISIGIRWNAGIRTIVNAAIENPPLAAYVKGTSANDILLRWLKKYKSGLDLRMSQRHSKIPRTVPDSAVDLIVRANLSHLTSNNIAKIRYAHRLAMSAEYVLGLLLEEYLAIELRRFGWHFAWGNTLRSIDFAHEDGRLRQIKNRSNSENSSSSRVRLGTSIDKWHRVNATTGDYRWDDLNRAHKTGKFSEEKFRKFIAKTLKRNPKCFPIEDLNPWGL